MDPQLMQLAQTAGATSVALMATEAWAAPRNRVVPLWGRVRPSDAEDVATASAPALERVVHAAREQLPPGEQSLIGSLHISAHATGNSRVHQAGRDQHISER